MSLSPSPAPGRRSALCEEKADDLHQTFLHLPMVGSLPGCGARAASGHVAAAPPSATSNSRRPMVTVIRPSRARCVKDDTTPPACSLHVREGGDAAGFRFGPSMTVVGGVGGFGEIPGLHCSNEHGNRSVCRV